MDAVHLKVYLLFVTYREGDHGVCKYSHSCSIQDRNLSHAVLSPYLFLSG